MFEVILLEEKDGKTVVSVSQQSADALPDGDVLIKVDYSTINFKDGLAIIGASPVVRCPCG